jgi:hypothetical protein
MLIELYRKDREIYINRILITKIKYNGFSYIISDQYYFPKDGDESHRYFHPTVYKGKTMEECFNIFIEKILPTIITDLLNHFYKYSWYQLDILRHSNDTYQMSKVGKYLKIVSEHKQLLDKFKDGFNKIEDILEKFKNRPDYEKIKRFAFTDLVFEIDPIFIVKDLGYVGFVTFTEGIGSLTEKSLYSYRKKERQKNIVSTQYVIDGRDLSKYCAGCGKLIGWYGTFCVSCKREQMGEELY